MAKKDKVEVEEKVNDYNEIHDSKIEDLAQVIDDAVAKDESKPKENKVEEKADKVVVEDKPGIDEEALTKKISDKVAKETADKIMKSLTGEEATPEDLNDYQKFQKEIVEKEGRAPRWDEALELLEKKAIERLEQRQAEKIKADEEAKAQQEKVSQEREKTLNDYIDSELNELIEAKKIPAIVDKDNPDDPGVKARKAIFASMLEVNTERTKAGKTPIYSPARIFYESYKDPNKQPAGEDAPIGGGRSSIEGEDKQHTYEEVHNRSFFDLLRGK